MPAATPAARATSATWALKKPRSAKTSMAARRIASRLGDGLSDRCGGERRRSGHDLNECSFSRAGARQADVRRQRQRVRMVSRRNRSALTATSSRPTARAAPAPMSEQREVGQPQCTRELRHEQPVIGTMISTPTCWAVRASFTRDDTMIAACSDDERRRRADQSHEHRGPQVEHRRRDARLGQPRDAGRSRRSRPAVETPSVGHSGPEHLGDEQLDRRDRRGQQRLERPCLLLADDGMRGERHRAGDRRAAGTAAGTAEAGRAARGLRCARTPGAPTVVAHAEQVAVVAQASPGPRRDAERDRRTAAPAPSATTIATGTSAARIARRVEPLLARAAPSACASRSSCPVDRLSAHEMQVDVFECRQFGPDFDDRRRRPRPDVRTSAGVLVLGICQRHRQHRPSASPSGPRTRARQPARRAVARHANDHDGRS